MMPARALTIALEGRMLLLWRLRCDTWCIARRLEMPEWQVANILPRLRAQARGEG